MQTAMNKTVFLIFLVIIVSIMTYFLMPILTPFLVAALVAYLTAPIVEKICSLGVPRLMGVLVVFLIIIVVFVMLLLLLVPLIQKQIVDLLDTLPTLISWYQGTMLPWMKNKFGFEGINLLTLKNTLQQNWSEASDVVSSVVKTALHSGRTVLEWLINLILI